MPIEARRSAVNSFFISTLVHASLIGLLVIFPPTKSFVFFKKYMTLETKASLAKEKILDEIDILKLPKIQDDQSISQSSDSHDMTLSAEEDFIPRIDLGQLLEETVAIDIPISTSQIPYSAPLEKSVQNYIDYLTPLSSPIPEDLIRETPTAMTYVEPKPQAFTYEEQQLLEPTSQDIAFSDLSKKLPDVLDTDLYTYTDHEKNQFFKMELKLKEHKFFEEQPQDFLFVIDLTHKNSAKNFTLYFDAILKSIKLLKAHDRFNLLLVGKNTTKLFETPQKFQLKTFEKLQNFQTKSRKQDGKSKDFSKEFEKILLSTEESPDHTSCILFTEDSSLNDMSIQKFTKLAHSKLSVFPVYYCEKKAKPLRLETLAHELCGKVLAPPTKASFNRKFTSLILDIKKARLKNVHIKLSSDTETLDVSLSEKTKQLSLKKPLKIFGKLKSTRNLQLHVMGSHGDDLYEIHKTIPIQEAKKGTSLIKHELEKLE